MTNPLIEKFNTPYGVTPFDTIKNEHFIPALKESIEIAQKRIDAFKREVTPQNANFENTLDFLESCQIEVEQVCLVLSNLHHAESNDELQQVAKEFSPIKVKFINDLILDEEIFLRVKACFDRQSEMNLSVEQKMLLEKTYKGFVRNGALLSHDQKERLRKIDEELADLSLSFADNYLKATNAFELEITNKNDLEGLPVSAIESAASEAKKRGKENSWVFTLHAPSYLPFMTYLKNEKMREQMYYAFNSRSFGGEVSNLENIKKIVTLRAERAKLLGYATHADFVLEERMAQKPQTVKTFLEKIKTAATPFAKKDMETLRKFKAEVEDEDPSKCELKRWDFSYYSEKLKKKLFDIDDEVLRPYFKLENVVSGMFEVASKLYQLSFKKLDNIPVYHSDVSAYEITDEKTGRLMAIFYTDFFPRPGKQGGAWMTVYREQKKTKDGDVRPHVAIVCNFPRPTENIPSLLSLSDVLTLFHEFGHALHGILSDCTYASLSGTNVYWDFVELPSQIMENWIYEKECLALFARHYQTGEMIPLPLVEKIKESSKYLEGYATIRQLTFGFLDMAWHSQEQVPSIPIQQFEKEAIAGLSLFPWDDRVNISCMFSHIFSGGYSAGYYSYKWAEVLDADAFEYFKEMGIFNRSVADKFRENVLSRGGSEHPMTLYKRFRGQEPDPMALLRRSGLV